MKELGTSGTGLDEGTDGTQSSAWDDEATDVHVVLHGRDVGSHASRRYGTGEKSDFQRLHVLRADSTRCRQTAASLAINRLARASVPLDSSKRSRSRS